MTSARRRTISARPRTSVRRSRSSMALRTASCSGGSLPGAVPISASFIRSLKATPSAEVKVCQSRRTARTSR